MPITTFLHGSELDQPTGNAVLDVLLKDVRWTTKRNWQIVKHEIVRSKWIFIQRRSTIYGLYLEVGGVGPWQVMNFYRDGTGTSINTENSAELVAAFLHGVLAGHHFQPSEQ